MPSVSFALREDVCCWRATHSTSSNGKAMSFFTGPQHHITGMLGICVCQAVTLKHSETWPILHGVVLPRPGLCLACWVWTRCSSLGELPMVLKPRTSPQRLRLLLCCFTSRLANAEWCFSPWLHRNMHSDHWVCYFKWTLLVFCVCWPSPLHH